MMTILVSGSSFGISQLIHSCFNEQSVSQTIVITERDVSVQLVSDHQSSLWIDLWIGVFDSQPVSSMRLAHDYWLTAHCRLRGEATSEEWKIMRNDTYLYEVDKSTRSRN